MQVPFVDEQRLLTAAKSVPPARLTEAERARNKLGDMLVFEYKDGEHCKIRKPNPLSLDTAILLIGHPEQRQTHGSQRPTYSMLVHMSVPSNRFSSCVLQAPKRNTSAPRRCPISLPACSSPTAGACVCRRRRRCLTALRVLCLR